MASCTKSKEWDATETWIQTWNGVWYSLLSQEKCVFLHLSILTFFPWMSASVSTIFDVVFWLPYLVVENFQLQLLNVYLLWLTSHMVIHSFITYLLPVCSPQTFWGMEWSGKFILVQICLSLLIWELFRKFTKMCAMRKLCMDFNFFAQKFYF